MSIGIGPRWLVELRGDAGGFGAGADFTWQAVGVIGYEISSRWTARAGYRRLDVDYQKSNDGFLYDAGYRGAIVSATYRF